MISSDVRTRFLMAAFLLAGVIVFFRLFTWQVLQSDVLAAAARSQHQTSTTLQAKRGSILASDGFPLIASRESFLVWTNNSRIKEKEIVADKLSTLFIAHEKIEESSDSGKIREQLAKDEKDRIKKLLERQNAYWVPIKHKVSKEIKEQIENLNISGIGFDPQESMEYPEGTMAARMLGFVGKDSAGQDKGYFGLEGFYDLTLSGSRGAWDWEKDAFGNPIVLGESLKVGAMDGMDLKTTIDRTVQFITEKHLIEGINKYDAVSGLAVVIDPRDGSILASASIPSYDPSRFSTYKSEDYIDPVVGEAFEPGSIFKVLVMAAALDAGGVDPDNKCDTCSGPRKIAEYTISTGTGEYHPDSTPADIIRNSDNVGMIWVSEKMGIDKFYDYITRFGIGQPTGVDLQGETNPPLRPKKEWRPIDLATASFGQGVAVTPMQMVRAVSVLANGGKLPTPRVVDKVVSQDLEEAVRYPSPVQVISPKAVRQITDMMTSAVDSRSDMWIKPKQIKVAGKTGTAQVPIAGHYDPEKTIASFIGFAPADNPKFVMIVSLKDPKAAPFASQTAAPLWFSIANDLFPYLKIMPR